MPCGNQYILFGEGMDAKTYGNTKTGVIKANHHQQHTVTHEVRIYTILCVTDNHCLDLGLRATL